MRAIERLIFMQQKKRKHTRFASINPCTCQSVNKNKLFVVVGDQVPLHSTQPTSLHYNLYLLHEIITQHLFTL